MTMKSMKKSTRDLSVKISEDAKNKSAREAAEKLERVRVLEEEISVFASPRKKEIKERKEEAAKLGHEAATGERIAPVSCSEIWDTRRFEVSIQRDDLAEVVDGPRPMTDAERKQVLQGEFEYDVEEQDNEPEEREPDEAPTEAPISEVDSGTPEPANDAGEATDEAPPAAADKPAGKRGKRGPRVKLTN